MKKIFVILCFIPLFVFSQKNIDLVEFSEKEHNEFNQKILLSFTDGIKDLSYYNGIRQFYYSRKKIKAIVTYTDGIKNGSAAYYWKNGNLMYDLVFLNGIADGLMTSYWENGKIESNTTFDNGYVIYAKGYLKNGEVDYEVRITSPKSPNNNKNKRIPKTNY